MRQSFRAWRIIRSLTSIRGLTISHFGRDTTGGSGGRFFRIYDDDDDLMMRQARNDCLIFIGGELYSTVGVKTPTRPRGHPHQNP